MPRRPLHETLPMGESIHGVFVTLGQVDAEKLNAKSMKKAPKNVMARITLRENKTRTVYAAAIAQVRADGPSSRCPCAPQAVQCFPHVFFFSFFNFSAGVWKRRGLSRCIRVARELPRQLPKTQRTRSRAPTRSLRGARCGDPLPAEKLNPLTPKHAPRAGMPRSHRALSLLEH